jgi:hypothetical protein
MMTTILASILALLAIGWVLRINAKDRKRFEKELGTGLADEPGEHA